LPIFGTGTLLLQYYVKCIKYSKNLAGQPGFDLHRGSNVAVHRHVWRRSETDPVSYPMGTAFFPSGIKRLEWEIVYIRQTSAEVENMWSLCLFSLYLFMAWPYAQGKALNLLYSTNLTFSFFSPCLDEIILCIYDI